MGGGRGGGLCRKERSLGLNHETPDLFSVSVQSQKLLWLPTNVKSTFSESHLVNMSTLVIVNITTSL